MIRCFVDKYSLLCASDESSINYAIDKKMKEINKEDESLEETTIKAIISSCENLLDDLEVGNNINDEDMQDIIYADNVLLDIQQRIGANLSPTNISSSYTIIDDEHGNCI
tara:strand:- start:237 stop:566 length:330 start_codon:yes stop_codon:yes gene_type:complete